MQRPSLDGRSILIVEDEPLIVMDITQQFEATGAALTTTNTLHHALILAEHDGLSGAIIDHALGDGDSSLLCARLKERGIPFMLYSGFDTITGPCAGAPHISKPADPGELVATMEGLIREDELFRGSIRNDLKRKASNLRSSPEENPVNTSSKPIPASETLIDTSVAKPPFAPPGGFAMWRRFRKPLSETEKVRGGSGPLDNLVVLIASLTLLAVLGVGLLWYFGYWPGGHPTLTEHG